MKPFHQDSREAHHTKRGPGRKHSQGPRGRSRPHGRGFKGATFSVPERLSLFHPAVQAEIAAALNAGLLGEAMRIRREHQKPQARSRSAAT